jgi:GAF domain-containing protein
MQTVKNRDYHTALQHIEGVLAGENDLIANLSNVAAILKQLEGYFWVGFYIVKGNELVLGPFQGPVACTRIGHAKGVCGTSWAEKRPILVPDVHQFPGHIACNSASLSELVVPVYSPLGEVAMVLDADSDRINDFAEADRLALEKVACLLTSKLK